MVQPWNPWLCPLHHPSIIYANTMKYKDVIFSSHFFPQKVVCIAFIVLPFCFGPYLTLLTGNHPTSGQRASSFFLCDTMWFSWKTQPFVVQPGSGDTSGLLYLSLWSLWEWGANWINVCLPARSFNWGMLLRFEIGNKRGKGEKGKKTCQSKSISKRC